MENGKDIFGNVIGTDSQGNPNDKDSEGNRPKDGEGNAPKDAFGNETGEEAK